MIKAPPHGFKAVKAPPCGVAGARLVKAALSDGKIEHLASMNCR